MKYITLVMLMQAKASPAQQALFKSTFGLEAELTEANMVKAIEAGLDFGWLTQLLPHTMRKAYESQRNTLLLNALQAPRLMASFD